MSTGTAIAAVGGGFLTLTLIHIGRPDLAVWSALLTLAILLGVFDS